MMSNEEAKKVGQSLGSCWLEIFGPFFGYVFIGWQWIIYETINKYVVSF